TRYPVITPGSGALHDLVMTGEIGPEIGAQPKIAYELLPDLADFMESSGRCIQVALADKRECQVARQEDHTAVRLQLFGDNTRVRIEVWDADPRPPAPKDPREDGIPDLEGEGGRG